MSTGLRRIGEKRNRRRTLLWGATSTLLVMVTSLAVWNHFANLPLRRPFVVSANGQNSETSEFEQAIRDKFREAAPDVLAWQKWESLPLTRESVARVTEQMSWRFETAISPQQFNLLRTEVCSTLWITGSADVEDYLVQIRRRGEHIDSGWIRDISPLLIQLGADENVVKRQDPEEILRLWHALGIRSGAWSGLCANEASAWVYAITSEDALIARRRTVLPGMNSTGSTQDGMTLAEPEEDIQTVLKRDGQVIVADVVCFAKHEVGPHQQSKTGAVLPYLLRFWFDAKKNVWHPFARAQNFHSVDFSRHLLF